MGRVERARGVPLFSREPQGRGGICACKGALAGAQHVRRRTLPAAHLPPPQVSTDYVNDSRSSIVDAACTQVGGLRQAWRDVLSGGLVQRMVPAVFRWRGCCCCRATASLLPACQADSVSRLVRAALPTACWWLQVIDGTMVKIYAWYDNEVGQLPQAELPVLLAASLPRALCAAGLESQPWPAWPEQGPAPPPLASRRSGATAAGWWTWRRWWPAACDCAGAGLGHMLLVPGAGHQQAGLQWLVGIAMWLAPWHQCLRYRNSSRLICLLWQCD